MKFDVMVAGVGGQGVLTVAQLLAASANSEGLYVKQSESHGMSQRGGTVVSHVRIADEPINSGLIPRGSARMVLALEPLECVRWIRYLHREGVVLTARNVLNDISDYPAAGMLLERLESIDRCYLLDIEEILGRSKAAGLGNVFLLGSASCFLPIRPESFEVCLEDGFRSKGRVVIERNLWAFREGRRTIESMEGARVPVSSQ